VERGRVDERHRVPPSVWSAARPASRTARSKSAAHDLLEVVRELVHHAVALRAEELRVEWRMCAIHGLSLPVSDPAPLSDPIPDLRGAE
jgi:hypothetical protein